MTMSMNVMLEDGNNSFWQIPHPGTNAKKLKQVAYSPQIFVQQTINIPAHNSLHNFRGHLKTNLAPLNVYWTLRVGGGGFQGLPLDIKENMILFCLFVCTEQGQSHEYSLKNPIAI